MNESVRILLVEDLPTDVELAQREIRKVLPSCAFEQVETREDFLMALERFQPDLIISDYHMPRFDGMTALKLALERLPDTPVIMWTGSLSENIAVECMKAGASNYVIKEHIKRLGPAVTHALEEKQLRLERKHAEEEIRRRTEQVTALHKIDTAIIGNFDLKQTLSILLEHTLIQLKADAAAVLLLDSSEQRLVFAVTRGFRTNSIEDTHLQINEKYSGRSIIERRTLVFHNLMESSDISPRSQLLKEEGFVFYSATPLFAGDKVKGVFEVYQRSPFNPTPEWLDFYEAISTQAAIAIDNRQLIDDLRLSNAKLTKAYDETLEGWSRAMDFRDKETEGHTQRVTRMTLQLVRAMGINEPELQYIRWGALLHDIGKIGIPDHILNKNGKLTDEEWAIMRTHPEVAYEMLAPIGFLHPALDIPYCHHEKWDGTGYPRGLKGEQIPLAARIFAVVDVWDALSSDRPYSKQWPEEKVVQHIRSQAGKYFDPQVVEAFLKLMDR